MQPLPDMSGDAKLNATLKKRSAGRLSGLRVVLLANQDATYSVVFVYNGEA